MSIELTFSASVYRKRLAQLRSLLSSEHRPTAALIESASEVIKSADAHYPYAPDTNLLYLTGWRHAGLLVLVSPLLPRPVFFCRPPDRERAKWVGELPSASSLAKRLGAELVESESIFHEMRQRLSAVDVILCAPRSGTVSAQLVDHFVKTPAAFRRSGPRMVGDLDLMLSALRILKSAEEIRLIERAASISASAFACVLPLVERRATEKQIAERLEHEMRMGGGDVAFDSIVAAGRNAATLHHSPTNRRPAKGESVLLDFGASFQGYASDVSRPISCGPLPQNVRAVHEVVHAAEEAAIRAVRPGVFLSSVSAVAERILCEGLVDLGVLKGRVSSLLKERAHKIYFPHSIGHSLGLDTHDATPRADAKGVRLLPGMVITIEPGLYFRERVRKIPPCGVRVEDDVLVTATGSRVLTEEIPKGGW